jgi:hypothetical protein
VQATVFRGFLLDLGQVVTLAAGRVGAPATRAGNVAQSLATVICTGTISISLYLFWSPRAQYITAMNTKHLAASETWSTELRRGPVVVHVLKGIVWVTQEADLEDHVLVAPAAFTADHAGRLAMQALSPADVELVPVAHAGRRAA